MENFSPEELARIREEEVRRINANSARNAFAEMTLDYWEKYPTTPYSGLVEQQRWFRIFAVKQGLVRPNQ
jgi:hypothetical protein